MRVHVPKLVKPSEEKPFAWFNPKPPPPRTKMAHVSSGRLLMRTLMACCCSPCICIIAPGFIFVSKLRKRIKKNSNRSSGSISDLSLSSSIKMVHFSSGPLRPINLESRDQEISLESRFRVRMSHSSSGPLRVKDSDVFEEEDSDSGSWLDSEFGGRVHESSGTV